MTNNKLIDLLKNLKKRSEVHLVTMNGITIAVIRFKKVTFEIDTAYGDVIQLDDVYLKASSILRIRDWESHIELTI